MIRPYATTTASSTPAETRSSMSWVTGIPSSVAASLTGLGECRSACPAGGRAGSRRARRRVPLHERAQRRDGQVRCAEIRQPSHPLTVGQTAGASVRTGGLSG